MEDVCFAIRSANLAQKGNFNRAERKGNPVCTLTYLLPWGTKVKGWSPHKDTSVGFSGDIYPRAVWDPTAVLDGMHRHHGTWKTSDLGFLDLAPTCAGQARLSNIHWEHAHFKDKQCATICRRRGIRHGDKGSEFTQINTERSRLSDVGVHAGEMRLNAQREELWGHSDKLGCSSAVPY